MFYIEKISPILRLASLDLKAYSQQKGINNKRELEGSGIRFLLEQLFEGVPPELEYSENRKPSLKGRGVHISISHSHDKLVVLLNDTESTGVDIELIRDKVKLIQHKFLNSTEKQTANNDVELLIAFWAAKEAVFKAYGLGSVDFIENIFVEDLNKENSNFTARLEISGIKRTYALTRRKVDNYVLVYINGEIQ